MNLHNATPLRIAEVRTGLGRGMIGITIAPGKYQPDAMSGPMIRDLRTDLDVIARWNAAAVVTLIEHHELEALRITALGAEVRHRHMEWFHWPIRDYSVPDARFLAAWPENSRRVRALLENGANVLIHCKGGLGRAGMVAARILAEMGTEPATAIANIRAVRPGAIQTGEQEDWVRDALAYSAAPQESRSTAADRASGALMGLAVGDAVGAALEFSGKPQFARLQDMIGGGPFGLKPGQWTDDTAMALALADSLLKHAELDPTDLMTRFVEWHARGTYSCTGACFDIGNTVRSALARFEMSGDPLAGCTAPHSAGNGALMRLAPVAILNWDARDKLREMAAFQTRVTHGAIEAVDASILFAEMLADAISGRPLHAVMNGRRGPFVERVDAIASGSWRGRHRDTIHGEGYVIQSLEAALWAVSRTTSFRSAVLLAANLGRDADTTAAIAGQLAGACYGLSGIPEEWISKLAWSDRIRETARALFARTSLGCASRASPQAMTSRIVPTAIQRKN